MRLRIGLMLIFEVRKLSMVVVELKSVVLVLGMVM